MAIRIGTFMMQVCVGVCLNFEGLVWKKGPKNIYETPFSSPMGSMISIEIGGFSKQNSSYILDYNTSMLTIPAILDLINPKTTRQVG